MLSYSAQAALLFYVFNISLEDIPQWLVDAYSTAVRSSLPLWLAVETLALIQLVSIFSGLFIAGYEYESLETLAKVCFNDIPRHREIIYI